jgi:hypothetical protein
MPLPRPLEEIQNRRRQAGIFFSPEPIPSLPLPMSAQYREPQPYARSMLSTCARYVAHHLPHDIDPSVPVKSLKIYRVLHNLITPPELAEGNSPLDPRYFLAFYQGEYDRDGNLLNPDDDPFLYWLIPIVEVPEGWPNVPFDSDGPKRLLDCVKMHAEYKPSGPKNPQ